MRPCTSTQRLPQRRRLAVSPWASRESFADGRSFTSVTGSSLGEGLRAPPSSKLNLTFIFVNRAKLFEPAIKVARDGFLVNVDLAAGIQTGETPRASGVKEVH